MIAEQYITPKKKNSTQDYLTKIAHINVNEPTRIKLDQ